MKAPVLCWDGKERNLGDDNYLNRLQEYLKREFAKSSSRELLDAEFDILAIYIRKIDGIASKGVHAKASQEEAKQGLICLYFFLYNMLMKKNAVDAQSAG